MKEIIRFIYQEQAGARNAVLMAAYMKDRFQFFGVKAPQRKVLQREIFKQYKALSLAEILPVPEWLWQQPERELQYLAQEWLFSRKREFEVETISVIEKFITTKSWWDTVDFLAAHCLGEWCRRFPGLQHKIILRFAASDNMWLQRSAILHQLFYRESTDTEMLAATILPCVASKEFFPRKAIGWALRQYAKTDRAWVEAFAGANPLSPLSRREALLVR